MKLKSNEFYAEHRAVKYLERRTRETGQTYYIASFTSASGRTVYGVYA